MAKGYGLKASAERVRPSLGVVVVEPLAVVRAGLSLLIGDRQEMKVLAEAGSADHCLEALKRIRRDRLVVLVSLGLSGARDSLWLIESVREGYPHATILLSGAGADAATISRALFMGADGYVDKDVDPAEFLQAIHRAARGEVVMAGTPVERMAPIAEGIDSRRLIASRTVGARRLRARGSSIAPRRDASKTSRRRYCGTP